MGGERDERRCGEEINVPARRTGGGHPLNPSLFERAERHATARRGLRRRPTGTGGRAAVGAACGVRQREPGAGRGVGLAGKGRVGVGVLGSNAVGSGGGWSVADPPGDLGNG